MRLAQWSVKNVQFWPHDGCNNMSVFPLQAGQTWTNDLVLWCTPYHCLHTRSAMWTDPYHHEPHSCHSSAHNTHGIIANVKKEEVQLTSFGRHGSCRTGNLMLPVSSNTASSACQEQHSTFFLSVAMQWLLLCSSNTQPLSSNIASSACQ